MHFYKLKLGRERGFYVKKIYFLTLNFSIKDSCQKSGFMTVSFLLCQKTE